jgi:hypothetical protein
MVRVRRRTVTFEETRRTVFTSETVQLAVHGTQESDGQGMSGQSGDHTFPKNAPVCAWHKRLQLLAKIHAILKRCRRFIVR